MIRAVCIGECMVELRAMDGESDAFARSYAGDAFNTAVYLQRSLTGARVQFLTATGDDALSGAMRSAWTSQGIDSALAYTVSGATPGLYLIETGPSGERRFQYWRRDSAAQHWLPLLLAQGESSLWGADLIYLSGISLAILAQTQRVAALALLDRLKGRVGRIAFDPNVRPSLWESPQAALATLDAALQACDIALPSNEDLQLLFKEASPQKQLKLLEARGIPEIALTLGPEGCVVSEQQSRTWLPAIAARRVVDTSGAGDSFNGAYLAMRLSGATPQQAAQSAMAIAARVVTHRGAIVPAAVSHP